MEIDGRYLRIAVINTSVSQVAQRNLDTINSNLTKVLVKEERKCHRVFHSCLPAL